MRSRSSKRDETQDFEEDDDRPSRAGAFVVRLARNPKEAIAACLALAASVAVIVNALFLQTGPHPAPLFFTHVPAPAKAADATGSVVLPRPRPAELDAAREGNDDAAPTPAPTRALTPAPAARPVIRTAAAGGATHDDPIALLLAPSKRVLAVQRALADFGYGQVTPTGIDGPATAAAIKKFERAHKLPLTGQISERFLRELAAATGRSFD